MIFFRRSEGGQVANDRLCSELRPYRTNSRMLDKGQNAAAEPVAPVSERLGRYELIARIADGGMAEVYLARQLGPMNFQKVVVVKKIHPNLARQKEFIGMLLDEARISALIKHPRVVDIYDLGVSRGIYFIAMEYLSGQPLTNVITRGRVRTPLDVYSTARIIADAAEGLHAAHNLKTLSGRALELVHRDVSPSNIIVLYDGSVKLVDFGVAKARGRITETNANQIKGKVGYVSPEQIMENPTDRRSDVFALGVVMWEALALRRLFDAESEAGKLKQILDGVPLPPSAHRPEVPYDLDKICLRALAVKPDERYQSAGDVQSAIEVFLRDANYRREGAAITRFMTETFAAERKEEEQLLRRLADADQAAAAPRKAKTPPPKIVEPAPAAVAVPMPPPGVDLDRDTTQTEEGDVLTATGETKPSAGRQGERSERDVDTDVRTFVHRPGEMSSTRIGEHAKAARATALTPPTATLGPPTDPGPAGEDRTKPTKVLAGGTPTRPMPQAANKKKRADTADPTVPGAHPAILDPDGIITEVPPTKPRGKRRTTGRQPIREPAAPDPTAQLRGSSSRILPLPAPKSDTPMPEPDHPFEDSDDDGDGDDVDITEVDSTAGKKFDDLLAIGAAQPAPGARSAPSRPALPGLPGLPEPAPVAIDAPTEVEDVEELSRIDLIDPQSSGRRRLWIVGAVSLMASALVAISVVWALDSSSRDSQESHEEGALAEDESLPVGSVAPAPAAEPVREPEPEPAPPAAQPAKDENPEPPQPQPPAVEKAAPAHAEKAAPAHAEKAAPAHAEKAARDSAEPSRPKGKGARTAASATDVAPRKKTPPPEPSAGAGSTPAAPAASLAQLYKEGAQLTLAGKLAEAQKKYVSALRVSPGYAPALRGLGLVYEKSGQKAKAIKSLQAYLRLAPKAADAAAIRARIERLRN